MSSLDGLPAALGVLRKRRKLTQAAVEKEAGLAAGTLSRYERGEKEPRLETLRRVLDVFGVDLYDLGVEARKAAGGETPTTNGETGPREGRLRLRPEEWERLEEEARATARWMVERELRDLRGLDPGPGGGSGA